MSPARDRWGSRLGFVMAAAGSAVGLGNLWKFPYITWHNRGGGFVLVYLLCIAAVGLPIMMAEILIGRSTQRSTVGGLKAAVGERWGLVGGLGVTTAFVILAYYSVIAGWTLSYLARCLAWSVGGYPVSRDGVASFTGFAADGGVQVGLTAIFLALTAGIVARGVGAGIERTARWLMPVLVGILLLLLTSALTMPGAGRALAFVFEPRFETLGWEGVLEGLGHSFFTLSLGLGAMITYGSYLDRRESIPQSALVVVVLDTVIAVIATLVMFSVIFSIPGLAESIGPSAVGMLFITLPEMFYTVVPFGVVLAPLFYLLVAFAALTSTISLLEVVVSYFIDERGWARRNAVLGVVAGVFVLAAGCALSLGAWAPLSGVALFAGKRGLLATADHLVSNWLLPVGGLLITLAAGWFMTREATEAELAWPAPRWFRYRVWRFFIRWVAPLAVASILLAVLFVGKDFS